MTKQLINSIRNDVTAQMQLIQEMAEALQALYTQAGANDEELRRAYEEMAAHLRELSEKAYSVGEKVLDAA